MKFVVNASGAADKHMQGKNFNLGATRSTPDF
jgi:hypothetical protein